MPLIEGAFMRAEDAARDEWHVTGGDFTATLRAGIEAYMGDHEVADAARNAVYGDTSNQNVATAQAILQVIGA